MEFIKWIPSLIGLFIAGFNAAIFCVIKFNDLKHVEKNLQSLTDVLKKLDEKLDKNSERIAKIEGKCATNHGN